jgi:hypothetical protein
VEEVLDEALLYWTPTLLPSPLVGARSIHTKGALENFCLNLEFDLCELSFVKDYTVQNESEDHPLTIALTVPNQTFTIGQAQKLEKLVRRLPYAHCFYKVEYAPFTFGLMELILQNYTALFAVGTARQYILGRFTVA